MATSFDRWVKDPFFFAAEEVQESADRMESVYRQWIQEKKVEDSNPTRSASAELLQELRTALGTAKWQLEELDRAVRSNDEAFSAEEATRSRHSQFVAAIGNRISMVEDSLKESSLKEGETAWVRLDEGERDELAVFLSGSHPQEENVAALPSSCYLESSGVAPVSCNSCNSNESSSLEMKEETVNGHRRAASDIGSWKILVSSEDTSRRLPDEQPNIAPPRILSFSGLTSVELTSKTKWYRNGFRKWKGGHQYDTEESLPLRSQQLARGINVCYEKSKSCLSSCEDESCDKQIDGWVGAIQRQFQRSQYQIQYGRPIQMIVWAILAGLLIVLFVLRSR